MAKCHHCGTKISLFTISALCEECEEKIRLKAKGVYKGGKQTIDRDQVHQLKVEGLSTYKIAEAMGISRMSVHRILNTESA